jgi:protein TonB
MNLSENIPGFNDLIFEFRNKDYGAYQLRKRYISALVTGIIGSIFLGCCAVIIPFVLNKPGDRVLTGGSRYVQVNMDILEPPKEEIYVPQAPPPPESPKVREIVKYVPPEVVDTIIPVELATVSTDELLAQPGDDIVELEVGGTGGYGNGLLSGEGSGIITDEPFIMVEVMPSFRGGDINRFREWVMKRTNYPQEAIDKKIQGRVFLTFIIEPDGAVSNVTIVKGVDPIIDNEAVKTIEASPRWSPGLQRGQPVRVRYSLWLNFLI